MSEPQGFGEVWQFGSAPDHLYMTVARDEEPGWWWVVTLFPSPSSLTPPEGTPLRTKWSRFDARMWTKIE